MALIWNRLAMVICGLSGQQQAWNLLAYSALGADFGAPDIGAAKDLAQAWQASCYTTWLSAMASDYQLTGVRVNSNYYGEGISWPYPTPGVFGTGPAASSAAGLGIVMTSHYLDMSTGRPRWLHSSMKLPGAPKGWMTPTGAAADYLAAAEALKEMLLAPLAGALYTWRFSPGPLSYSNFAQPDIRIQVRGGQSALRRRNNPIAT